jgi:(2R)-sulfolactate sulfo-lyase subunit alpha
MAKHKFLLHEPIDSVGVAVADIKKGEKIFGAFLHGDELVEVVSKHDIPLGHKIAIKAVKSGDYVIKYDEKIGIASQDIQVGDWVHTHNLKGARWGKK